MGPFVRRLAMCFISFCLFVLPIGCGSPNQPDVAEGEGAPEESPESMEEFFKESQEQAP